MPFQPGISGNPAGKPPGTKNKKNVLRAFEVLLEKGKNPIEELIVIAETTKDLELQADIWKYIHTFCEAPQKEAVKFKPDTPAESVENASKMFDLLNGNSPPRPDTPGTPSGS